MDPVLIQQVAIAVAVVVITCIVLLLLKRRLGGPSRNDVLLVGLSGSGKTALTSQILHDQAAYTVTSMIANVVDYTVQRGKKRRTVRLCDLPGEDRVRTVCLESYLPSARGIVFVVDGASLKTKVKAVAQFLFELLTNETVVRNRVPVMIACNKQDVAGAESSEAVRSSLEAELTVVRNTHFGTAESSASSTLLNYKQSGQSRVREMTADIRATRTSTARTARIFGDDDNVSFGSVQRVFPVSFADCSAGRVDETLTEPTSDALKKVKHDVEALRDWIASL